MRKYIFFIILSFSFLLNPLSAAESIDLVDSPTAKTLDRGFFSLDFFVYNEGGIFLRTAIGVTDFLTIGVSESIDNAVGSEMVRFHIPSVLLKLKFYGKSPKDFYVSFGFAPHTFSDIGYRYGEQVQGLFLVARKGFVFKKLALFIHLGVRYPILPEEIRTQHLVSAYSGLSATIGSHFELKFEAANITFGRGDEFPRFNAGIIWRFTEMFGVELDLQYTKFGDEHQFNRMIKLNYLNIFY